MPSRSSRPATLSVCCWFSRLYRKSLECLTQRSERGQKTVKPRAWALAPEGESSIPDSRGCSTHCCPVCNPRYERCRPNPPKHAWQHLHSILTSSAWALRSYSETTPLKRLRAVPDSPAKSTTKLATTYSRHPVQRNPTDLLIDKIDKEL